MVNGLENEIFLIASNELWHLKHENALAPAFATSCFIFCPQVHSAEQNAPPRLANSIHSRRNTCGACARGDTGRTPLIPIQVKALAGRALLNVVRDPYLATLHLLLTPLVGVVVGSMFEDLRRLDSESAGVQVCLL